ncbi:MAG: heparin lyase I family protein [Acidobacteria bacterium]|uniref:Heparin lyase I family protein n=1 Tax=Candidatus Polarisedimenticola svalbardensis TaxID=2886004 RepID=A0A8J7C344_9BACT|nr:heparin lyase I family protein [Candidatus Polarisedimenticola svalbardensis]
MKWLVSFRILPMLLLGCSLAMADICKQESFDITGPNLAYGLDSVRGDRSTGTCSYPVSWGNGGQWCVEHDPSGGDGGEGDGAAHIIFREGESQFNAGWFWGHSCGSWNNGDTLRIRFKIRFDERYIWNESHNNKFMIWGSGGYRMILFIRGEYWTSANCRPYGSGSYSRCTNDGSQCSGDGDCVDPNGVQYSCVEQGTYLNGGALAVGHDISNPCAGPAPAAADAGLGGTGWFYVQVEVKSGADGFEKIWINNNNYDQPNACTGSASACPGSSEYGYSQGRNPVRDIRVDGWETEQTVGDFWTDAVSRDMGYYIDDMIWEQNGSFDSVWFPGGVPACADGRDNDGDGLSDFPADPGCTSADDPGENNCGNGVIEGNEVCDGTQMGGESCISLGFENGVLGCGGSCLDYDTTYCASSSSGGGTLPMFTSDFETGDFSEWDGRREQNPGDLQVVSDASCAGGSRCARALLTAGTNSDSYADYYFGDHPLEGGQKVEELWLETSVKFSSGYVWPNSGQKVAILNATDGSSTQRRYQVIMKVDPSGRWSLQHSDIDDWLFFERPQNLGTPTTVAFDSWVRLKLYARMNRPGYIDGVLRLWVDGVLKAEYTDLNLRESTEYGFGKLILSSWATDASGSNGVQWYDDWVLSAADPGVGSGPPPTAPPGTVGGVVRTDTYPGGGE